MVRISSRTFEYYSGIGYRDESGKPIGCNFENAEDGKLHEVYPGKVYSIPVWVSTVDDDGCPEDVCISHYVQLLPCAE